MMPRTVCWIGSSLSDRHGPRGRFGGVGSGYGDCQNLLSFDAFEPDGVEPTFRFHRTDTSETVEITCHVNDVPDDGPDLSNLQGIVDGTANEIEYSNCFLDDVVEFISN